MIGFVTTIASALSLASVVFLSAQTSTPTPPRWIVTTGAITQLQNAGASPSLIDAAFYEPPASYVGGSVSPSGVPTAIYKSYDTLQKDFASGALPGPYRAILVDLEKWQYTPTDEQADPAKFERQSCQLAHSHGMYCVTTPAIDLYGTPTGYLNANAAYSAARFADAIGIQSQRLEASPSQFASFLQSATTQAKQANPYVTLLGGLTTSGGSGPAVTNTELLNAYNAGRPYVAGYWLNVPGGPSSFCPNCSPANPGPAVNLLQTIYPGK